MKFTLEDYLEQFEQMKNMGSMQDILGMIPGIDAGKLGNVQIDEKQMARTQDNHPCDDAAGAPAAGYPKREPQKRHCARQRHQPLQ